MLKNKIINSGISYSYLIIINLLLCKKIINNFQIVYISILKYAYNFENRIFYLIK